jgi:hypothetical protein
MMRDESRQLKRALNSQEKKAEEFQQNAELWCSRYQQLGMTYNELLRQYYAMTQWAQHASYPVPPPPSSAPAPPAHSAPAMPSQTTADRVTIDLTCDPDEDTGSSHPTVMPASTDSGEGVRNTMRNKNYHWLGDKNHMRQLLQPIQVRIHNQPTLPCYQWR